MIPDPSLPSLLGGEDLLAAFDLPGEHEVHVGRLVLPFGDVRDPSAFRRMTDGEQALVRSGLPLGGAATGLATSFASCGDPGCRPVTVETAWSVRGLVPDGASLQAPDLTARAGWTLGPVSVGASGWMSRLSPDDRAWGVDARLPAGPWVVSVAQAHERVEDVERLLGADLRRVWGERAGVRVARDLARAWTVSGLTESEVFHGRRGLALTPWGRVAVAVQARLGPVHWTVVEVADTLTFDGTPDLRRLSTRLERAGPRGAAAPSARP